MELLRKKLHSDKGASLLAALVFFLLCAAVGSVVLAAGSANAGRLRDQRRAYQDYLTASSAAQAVQEKLEGLSFTAEIREGSPAFSASGTGALCEAVRDAAQEIFQGGSPLGTEISLQLEDTAYLAEGELTMEPSYDIIITLAAKRDGKSGSPLILTLRAQTEHTLRYEPGEPQIVVDPETGAEDWLETKVEVETTYIKWYTGSIERGTAE